MIVIHGADKNLGTYVVPKTKYIMQSLKEHMLNPKNYVCLLPDEAEKELEEQKKKFKEALDQSNIVDQDLLTYFERYFETDRANGSRTPQFYALWKIHKLIDSVRPIISSCGSFVEIFSVFVDEMLKSLVQDVLPSYIISSDQLVYNLTSRFPGPLPQGAKLFSIDAVGMYTNIGTDHAINVIAEFMERYSSKLKDLNLPKKFIITCLEIIMTRNIFQFGDTFWKQIDGTAMGTSCAVNYAFLYVGLLEMVDLLKNFQLWLLFYGRFIDDGFGIWLTLKEGSANAWKEFNDRLNRWGRLKWTNTGFVDSLEFLDLTVSINKKNCLEFKTYRKPMNLNIYLPPNSAHPPDVIRSIVFGRVRAYFLHNTHAEDFITECALLEQNLIRCGWEWKHLCTHFNDAHESLMKQGKTILLEQAKKTRREKEAEKPDDRILVFRLPFHPRGVQRRQIRTAYRDSGLEEILSDRRFICAQCRPANLRDRVCSTVLEHQPGTAPSDFITANPQT